MPPVVEHRRLLEAQLLDAWRAYRLACLQDRWSTAEFTMCRINDLLDRLNSR